MSKELLSAIPQLEIDYFKKNDSGLLVIKLEELLKNYGSILKQPRRVSFFQLALVTSGTGAVCVDSFKYDFKPKSLFAVSNGQIVTLGAEQNIKGYAVLFSEEYIYKYPDDLQWINNLKLFDPMADSFLIDLSDAEFFELHSTIERIELEIQTDNSYAKEELLINTIKTLIIISERIKREKINDYSPDNKDVSCVTEFKKNLEAHYNESRLVGYYAEGLSVTSKKLNQVTCNYFGKPVKRLIEERVILETKRLLIHTNQTVKEIGHSLGFNDPTNFNKFFKKYMKQTPTEYRILNK